MEEKCNGYVRVSMAWEDQPFSERTETNDDGWPWERRAWYLSARKGIVSQCKGDTTPETRVPQGPLRPPEWPLMTMLSYPQMREIVERMKKTDETFAEAVLDYIGKEEFPPSFVKQALAAPKVRYIGVPEQNRIENQAREDESAPEPVKKKKRVTRKKVTQEV